jgi:hypothetical protein
MVMHATVRLSQKKKNYMWDTPLLVNKLWYTPC